MWGERDSARAEYHCNDGGKYRGCTVSRCDSGVVYWEAVWRDSGLHFTWGHIQSISFQGVTTFTEGLYPPAPLTVAYSGVSSGYFLSLVDASIAAPCTAGNAPGPATSRVDIPEQLQKTLFSNLRLMAQYRRRRYQSCHQQRHV